LRIDWARLNRLLGHAGRILAAYRAQRHAPGFDLKVFVHSGQRDAAEVYRHLRAAAESGWDFSTRRLAEPVPCGAAEGGAVPAGLSHSASLASICTTDIVPVDLNALLYKLETTIAELAAQAGDAALAHAFEQCAQARKQAVIAVMWDAGLGAFFDHDWRRGARRSGLTAACIVPLFAGLAEASHARALAATVARRLLAPGGLSSTECSSGQQWDQPNGWAPLEWMAVQGFEDHGQHALARTIAHRWLATVAAVYEREGKLVEKYALRQQEHESTTGGRGGEYPLQDGFGWTNGVTRALLAAHLDHTAHRCVAHAAEPMHS
jgi:alpha,alpha-trehalase